MKRFLLIITVLVLGIGSTWAQYLDRTGWTVLASSACQDGSTGQADAMLDGSTTTYWHSRYNNDNAYGTSNGGYPHAFQLDLGSEEIFYGVRIQNRTDNQGNGGVKAYKIYVSNEPFTTSTTGFQANDVTAGKTPVLTGTFSDTQTGALNQAGGTIEMSGRYLLFVITDGYKQSSWSGNHAHVAEVNLLATPHNSYIGSTKTNIGTTEWRTKENWSLQDIWNNNGPGCSSSGMWGAIYLQDINGGTIPALDGWNFRMTADHSTYTIESVGKIQFTSGNESYISLKNTSHVTMNFGNGQANPFIVNLNEGTGNILDFAMSDGFGSQITVNYGSVSKDMNRKFNASGSGTINTLILNATIEGSIISSENTPHSVVLGNVSSVTNLTTNITAENFIQTTGVLTATDDNVGKYSVVKENNGDITLYWVTGPIMTALTTAYAGARNINDGILTVNSNSSTISKNASGDIVLSNTNGFNNIITANNASGYLETTITFRIKLDAPTTFTKILTFSTDDNWTTDGNIGIGLKTDLSIEGLWNGGEYNKLNTDVLTSGTHIITVQIFKDGTRIYVGNKDTYYTYASLKTSNKTYSKILIKSDIANKINALYVYKAKLSDTEIQNVFTAINELPEPTSSFPNNNKLYIIKGHVTTNLNVCYNGTNDYVCINTTAGNTDNYKWAIYTYDNKTYLYNIGANKFVCQIPGTNSSTSWPLRNDVANEMVITENSSSNAFDYFTFRSKYCIGDQDYLHYHWQYSYGSTSWGNSSDDSKWRITEVGDLTEEQQQAIEQAIINHNHIPIAGKYYYIANDNDTKLQASDENGTLTFAVATNRTQAKYIWKAGVTSDGKFTFQNLATDKYLKHKGLQESAYNFQLINGFVPGNYSLYSEASSPYFVIKNDGTLDQASGTYNKTNTDFSTDYIFEEVISLSENSTSEKPVLEGDIPSPEIVTGTIDNNASIIDLRNTSINDTSIDDIKDAVVDYTNNSNVIIIAPDGTAGITKSNILVPTGEENTYTCNNLQLNDDVIAQFTGETGFTDTKVTYSRGTSANVWGTICLPYATSTEGDISYYRLVESSTSNLKFEKVTDATTTANEPYLIKKEAGAGLSIGADDQDFTIGVAGAQNGETYNGFKMQGVLVNTSVIDGGSTYTTAKEGYTAVTDADAYYFDAANNTFRKLNGRFNLKAFRAYLTATSGVARENIGIDIYDDDQPTGISIIESKDGNTVDVIFDLNGRRLQNAKKGVNIINGKKVIK